MRKGIKKFIGIASTVAIFVSGVANRYNDISNKEYTYYNCLPLECEDDNRIVCSFNIDKDLQRYIINLCKDNEYITPELLYAIMSYVSNYDKTSICGTKYYGLMQVDKQYFDMLEVTTDFARVFACSLESALMTVTSNRQVHPSPSPAIFLERSVII